MVSTPSNGADLIRLGSGDDNVNALRGNDRVFGDGGDDTLRGDGGRDRLFGGADEDRLFGGDRADDLNGGTGADRLSGGGGGDRFDYDRLAEVRGDTILDFSRAEGDRLDLAGIDPFPGSPNQALDPFLNPLPNPAPGFAGNVGFFDVGGDTVVVVNTDEGSARLTILDTDAEDVFDTFIA